MAKVQDNKEKEMQNPVENNPPKIEEIFLLYYVPTNDSVAYEDPLLFKKTLKGIIKKKNTVNLILHTLGGDPFAAAGIVNVLHEYFTFVRVIVPYWAMSAGTLIALGADEIVLSETAKLGPLDMQIAHPMREKQISALDYSKPVNNIVALVTTTAKRFYSNIRESSNRKLSNYEAMSIAYENAVKFFKPIFVNNYPDHNFGIFYEKLHNFGLNVVNSEAYPQWESVWQYIEKYIEDDCSPDSKYNKTIELIKIK